MLQAIKSQKEAVGVETAQAVLAFLQNGGRIQTVAPKMTRSQRKNQNNVSRETRVMQF